MATEQTTRPSAANAPRRHGRRTTLRVPATLEAELTQVSRRLGISENEALIHLASIGAGATKKQRALERLKARRRKAVTGHKTPSGEFPAPHEVREAILSDRG